MNSKNNLLKIIILATLFGFAAGIVGQLIATSYLLPREIFILGGEGRMKKNTTKMEEYEKIAEAHKTVSPTVFEIYPQKKETRNPLGQIYLPKERIALGVMLTSDGWLASAGHTLSDPKNKYIIITADQKVFSPQKIVFDEATGAIFLKIDAQNLPVPKLGQSENLTLGEKLLLPLGKQSIKITQIDNLAYEKIADPKDLLKSSEKFSKFILIANQLSEKEIGAPIVNLEGEVIGLLSGSSGEVMPINFWRTAFLSILKNNQIKRSYLGIHYINLAKTIRLNEAISQNQEKGALIWGDKSLQTSAVAKDSPALKAGLRSGDIILKIDTDEITAKVDLAELIQDYNPGDKIELTILRTGEKKTIEVTLGEKL